MYIFLSDDSADDNDGQPIESKFYHIIFFFATNMLLFLKKFPPHFKFIVVMSLFARVRSRERIKNLIGLFGKRVIIEIL